eukprot:ANDGO_04691.mRNA.1 hypothetical protein
MYFASVIEKKMRFSALLLLVLFSVGSLCFALDNYVFLSMERTTSTKIDGVHQYRLNMQRSACGNVVETIATATSAFEFDPLNAFPYAVIDASTIFFGFRFSFNFSGPNSETLLQGCFFGLRLSGASYEVFLPEQPGNPSTCTIASMAYVPSLPVLTVVLDNTRGLIPFHLETQTFGDTLDVFDDFLGFDVTALAIKDYGFGTEYVLGGSFYWKDHQSPIVIVNQTGVLTNVVFPLNGPTYAGGATPVAATGVVLPPNDPNIYVIGALQMDETEYVPVTVAWFSTFTQLWTVILPAPIFPGSAAGYNPATNEVYVAGGYNKGWRIGTLDTSTKAVTDVAVDLGCSPECNVREITFVSSGHMSGMWRRISSVLSYDPDTVSSEQWVYDNGVDDRFVVQSNVNAVFFGGVLNDPTSRSCPPPAPPPPAKSKAFLSISMTSPLVSGISEYQLNIQRTQCENAVEVIATGTGHYEMDAISDVHYVVVDPNTVYFGTRFALNLSAPNSEQVLEGCFFGLSLSGTSYTLFAPSQPADRRQCSVEGLAHVPGSSIIAIVSSEARELKQFHRATNEFISPLTTFQNLTFFDLSSMTGRSCDGDATEYVLAGFFFREDVGSPIVIIRQQGSTVTVSFPIGGPSYIGGDYPVAHSGLLAPDSDPKIYVVGSLVAAQLEDKVVPLAWFDTKQSSWTMIFQPGFDFGQAAAHDSVTNAFYFAGSVKTGFSVVEYNATSQDFSDVVRSLGCSPTCQIRQLEFSTSGVLSGLWRRVSSVYSFVPDSFAEQWIHDGPNIRTTVAAPHNTVFFGGVLEDYSTVSCPSGPVPPNHTDDDSEGKKKVVAIVVPVVVAFVLIAGGCGVFVFLRLRKRRYASMA